MIYLRSGIGQTPGEPNAVLVEFGVVSSSHLNLARLWKRSGLVWSEVLRPQPPPIPASSGKQGSRGRLAMGLAAEGTEAWRERV